MACPPWASSAATDRPDRPELGARRFRWRECQRTFHARTGTLRSRLRYPADVVALVGLWRVRYQVSRRDVAEMFRQRGLSVTHEAVREWEAKLAPLPRATLRRRRDGAVGNSRCVDETYINVQGRWQYLYRASERDGH